jgi:hypothetical protein
MFAGWEKCGAQYVSQEEHFQTSEKETSSWTTDSL